MSLLTVLQNEFKAAIGYKQKFDELIASKDISRAISYMQDNTVRVETAIKEYDVTTHEVMKRMDKPIYDSKGNFVRFEKRWKLPVPYQAFINEIALVFLYGRPVKWTQNSKDTDEGFQAFTDLLKKLRFDAKIRQAKRLAGAETESAILFRVFRNEENKPDCQAKVLAKSLGDEIKFIFDEYGNMIAFGWGYTTKTFTDSVSNFNIYTPTMEYHCTRGTALNGWDVKQVPNEIGKIPVIFFRQNQEHEGVQPLIEREEWMASRNADTIDYFADPVMVLNAEIIANMPEKQEEAKLLVVKNGTSAADAVSFATWDNASEAKDREFKWLENHILSKSFTPNFDYESLKGMAGLSGTALDKMLILANIKAAKHKETHDELMDRVTSLCKAIIGNVLNVASSAQMEKLIIGHEFQSPFGDDILQTIQALSDAYTSGGMSQETFVEMNPFVKDASAEMDRIRNEGAEKAKLQNDVFGQAQ